MTYINLNENPEAIYEMKEGDLAFIDNHRMVFEEARHDLVYLSSSDIQTRDSFYQYAHVRTTTDDGRLGRAVHSRSELVELIRSKSYIIY